MRAWEEYIEACTKKGQSRRVGAIKQFFKVGLSHPFCKALDDFFLPRPILRREKETVAQSERSLECGLRDRRGRGGRKKEERKFISGVFFAPNPFLPLHLSNTVQTHLLDCPFSFFVAAKRGYLSTQRGRRGRKSQDDERRKRERVKYRAKKPGEERKLALFDTGDNAARLLFLSVCS